MVNKKQRGNLLVPALAARLAFLICLTVPLDIPGLPVLSLCTADVESGVLVEHSLQWNATIYRIVRGECTVEWISRNTEPGVIKYYPQCELPLSQQLPLLRKICAEYLRSDKNAEAFHTLFWGRLAPDGTGVAVQEMSFRLALAAYKSAEWDAKRGTHRNGDINGFVKELANREMIYPELKELFDHCSRRVTFSCAEKVLVVEAGKLQYYEKLKPYGVTASDRLPFDCMAWFSVSAVHPKPGFPPVP